MQNRSGKIKLNIKKYLFTGAFRFFVCLVLMSGNNYLLAQNSTSSPYSRFGVGDLSSTTFARNLSLGGTEIGLDQPNSINYGNPAAYSGLWYTTYEGGFDFKQYEFKTNYSSHKTNTASVSYFDFAFPIKLKKWGLGFGLLPYSKVGYLATSTSTNSFGDTELAQYQGSGGLNNFHIGTGFKATKRLSLGLNAEYIFGVLNYDRIIAFNSSYYLNTATYSSTSVGWFHFQGGAQYRFDSIAVAKSDSLKMFETKVEVLQQLLSNLLQNKSGDTSQESYAKKNELQQQIAEAKLIKENIVVKKVKSDWHAVLGLIVAPAADLNAVNSTTINSFRYRSGLNMLIRDTVVHV